jgi:hypothetical protein
MDAFHRRWCVAQRHQAALVCAMNLQDTGMLTWESFSMAAHLVAHSVPPSTRGEQPMEQSKVLEAFQSACRLSRQSNTCSLAHARLKLFATFSRLWTMERLLPEQELVVGDDGVLCLPEGHEAAVEERAQALQGAITRAAEVQAPQSKQLLMLPRCIHAQAFIAIQWIGMRLFAICSSSCGSCNTLGLASCNRQNRMISECSSVSHRAGKPWKRGHSDAAGHVCAAGAYHSAMQEAPAHSRGGFHGLSRYRYLASKPC